MQHHRARTIRWINFFIDLSKDK